MTENNFTPPFPTNSGGASAPDVPSTANFTATDELKDALNWSNANADALANNLSGMWDKLHLEEKIFPPLLRAVSWIFSEILKWEVEFDEGLFGLESKVARQILPVAQSHAAEISTDMIDLLAEVLVGEPGPNAQFGSGKMSIPANSLYGKVANRFSLIHNGVNPATRGAGIQNQQYLVSQVVGMSLTEWAIDWASQHLGLGVLKDLQPFRNVLDEVVNTRNVIRQANNAAYAMLLHAPMTRDLNRAYPVKDLGLSALARLYVRGAITQADFFDKCLDSGLDSTQAQQLILESAKQLGSGTLGDLVNHAFMGPDDAIAYLKHSGYQDGDAKALLYAETHSRYWSIQERVGNAAVSAWTKRRITKDRLEEILRQCGFTDDEIVLLEIEQEFAKAHASKELTYSEVKQLFTANIWGIDAVIAFLDAQGYSAADRNDLILLDFTKLEERQTQLAKLAARDRVQADQERVQAAADEVKQETDLANARKALASALDDEAKVLGNLLVVPALTRL